MEQQPTCVHDNNDHNNQPFGTQVPITTGLPNSTIIPSVQSLRFPKPEGSQQLANWVSSSSHDNTHHPTMSEDGGSLGESSYELIHSPEQDSPDVMSESVSSLDCPRSEDVHSLNGSSHDENTDSESENGSDNEDQHSSASSIRYTNQVLQSPSTQANPTNLHFRRSPEASILPQSIEFLEVEEQPEGQVDVDEISVKHTVREFDEEETAGIASNFNLHNAPKRLGATIRQTMSPSCLSTQEPVRIMYTGSPQGLKDVVYKLSSAIWASGTTNGDASVTLRNSDAVYSIVPISSFGSSQAPEIELMESSGMQIKVEHCTAAREIQVDDGCSPEDSVYCIQLDPNNKTYKSHVTAEGAVIEPKWNLPHIAIFFLADSDGKEAQQTQDAAWEVMSRHNVPCIFICNNQSFERPPTGRWSRFIDQHAVHMCLESRDPERPMPPLRLPVDLESFLNIDARQMNRNLTYLTGLSEPAAACQDEKDLADFKSRTQHAGDGSNTAKSLLRSSMWTGICGYSWNNSQWLAPLAMALLTGLVAMLASVLMGSGQIAPSQLSLQSTSAISAIVPEPSTASVIKSSTSSVTTSITITVSTTTSTTTVNLKRADASASPLASALSFAGFLSDKASTAVPEPKAKHTTICSIERVSDRDILIHMPLRKKKAWSHGGALKFEVHRGDKLVQLSNISDVVEGFKLQLEKQDAYGAVKVSVLSAKKPKINETFQIDFGKGMIVVALEAGIDILQDIAANVAHTAVEDVTRVADLVAGLGQTIRDDAVAIAGHMEGASHTAQRAAGGAKDSLAQSRNRLTSALKNAKLNAANRVAMTKEDAELGVLKAQIASKLWWLKVRGQKEEYANYEQKASEFLKDRYARINKHRSQRHTNADMSARTMTACGCPKNRRKPCSRVDSPRKATTTIGRSWRRILVG